MDVFDLMAKLMLDSSAYEAGLNGAKKKATSVGGMIGKGLKKVAKLTGAALAATTTAVTGFAAASVKAGSAFDTSMSQVAATMGVTVDEIQELRDYALEMGSKTAFSATQAADALNYMALAGYDAETSMKMLPNVLSLAAAGNIDLASASDMVTDAQSALGLSLEETETMVDQMAAAASKSNTSVAQLGEAFLTVGATARNLKGGTQELATVLGILADNGIKGAEGGTHVRNAILSLQTPTKAGTEALKKLGMSYADMYDKAGNMRSLPEIFQRISGAMEGMNQKQKDAIVSGLFNKTDLAAVNALLGTSADRWKELGGAIGDSAGAAEKMAATQLDNLSGDVTLFQSALEGLKIAISDGLTPTLREFVQFGTEGLSKITEGFKKGGVEGAVDAFGEIVTNGISMITNKLPVLLNAGKKILGAVGRGILQNLPQIASTAAEIAVQLALGLAEATPQILEAIPQILGAIFNAIKEHWPELKEAGKKILIALGNGINDAIEWLDNKGNEALAQLEATIQAKITELIEKVKEKWEELKTNALEKWEEIKSAIAEKVQAIKDAVVEKVQAFVEAGKELVQGFLDGITEAWNTVKETVSNFFNGLVDTVKGILGIHSPSTVFSEIGSDTIAGYGEGVESESPSVLEKVSGFADSVIETASGIIKGINEKAGAVGSWIKDLFSWGNEEEGAANETENEAVSASQQTRDAIVNSMTGIESEIPGIFEKMATSSKTAMGKLTDAWTEVADLMKQALEELKTIFEDAMQAMEDRVASTVRNIIVQFKNLEKACREVAAAIRSAFNFNWSMPHIKVPHIVITYTPITDPTVSQMLGGATQMPNFDIIWYRKAYDNPYLFTKPTLMGFGDGNGGEMVYGHDNLMNDIREASNNTEIEAKLDQVVELMEYIVRNGLNANLSRNQVYRAINDENRKRSKATNYNSLAMA